MTKHHPDELGYGWQPIETAPLNTPILAAWYDDKILDDIQLISLLVRQVDWVPMAPGERYGKKIWFNHCSGNYGTPHGLNNWPTHWKLEPEPPL